MSCKTIFGNDLGDSTGRSSTKVTGGEARVKRPDRRQSILRPQVIDQLIPPDHRARAIAKFVEEIDLSAFYAAIKSRGSEPGRSATDPELLIGLWLFATSEGVGSGRQLERLCERDDAYRWLCGGVQMNYHALTDFRIDHGVFRFARRAGLQMVRHRRGRLRQPAVADRADAQTDQVNGLAIAFAELAVDRAMHGDGDGHRPVGADALADSCVELPAYLDASRFVRLRRHQRVPKGSSFDRRTQLCVVALDRRVVPISGSAAPCPKPNLAE